MAHIHTEPGQHDITAAGFVFRLDGAEPRVVFHLHKKLGIYAQFGGHIELNESPFEAVCREIMEESGYELSQLKLLQPAKRVMHLTNTKVLPIPAVFQSNRYSGELNHLHDDIDYCVVTLEAPKNKPSKGESEDIRMFTRQELIDLPKDKTLENIREAALFMFDNCLGKLQEVGFNEFD